ncbi:AAA family ATPase [Clostridium sp. BL-8]|uniref:AAA family ATPase n=1 Tax=Clostridium sp. BL-8 TaxID=349938 RepID=UPI00098C0427|nr:AAA family ATPase [Clostridium sp. BL-8]OOM80107.1 guanylate kinase [Clostridium sp. BL-8]
MRDKIICLVGESGSGKSTIAELLEKEGYNYIQSYTTRKPRFENEKGHIFVEHAPEVFDTIDFSKEEILKNGIIAHTYFDNNHYWATKEQYQNKGISLYIVDPEGVKEIKNDIKDSEIVAIYIKVDEEERRRRMLKKRDPQSVKDRIEYDREIFKIVQCEYVINNNENIDDTVKLIKQIID